MTSAKILYIQENDPKSTPLSANALSRIIEIPISIIQQSQEDDMNQPGVYCADQMFWLSTNNTPTATNATTPVEDNTPTHSFANRKRSITKRRNSVLSASYTAQDEAEAIQHDREQALATLESRSVIDRDPTDILQQQEETPSHEDGEGEERDNNKATPSTTIYLNPQPSDETNSMNTAQDSAIDLRLEINSAAVDTTTSTAAPTPKKTKWKLFSKKKITSFFIPKPTIEKPITQAVLPVIPSIPKFNYTRLPIQTERAMYRLSHVKLTNPKRPLCDQVAISNLMFWYLSIISQQNQRPHPPRAVMSRRPRQRQHVKPVTKYKRRVTASSSEEKQSDKEEEEVLKKKVPIRRFSSLFYKKTAQNDDDVPLAMYQKIMV